MSSTTIEGLATVARDLDDDRLRKLAATALVLAEADPASPDALDDDPVLPLLAGCLALSLANKRRLNDLLAQVIERSS